MVGSKENLLIFTVSPDLGATSSITSDLILAIIIFSLKYHLGLHFYRTFIF